MSKQTERQLHDRLEQRNQRIIDRLVAKHEKDLKGVEAQYARNKAKLTTEIRTELEAENKSPQRTAANCQTAIDRNSDAM